MPKVPPNKKLKLKQTDLRSSFQQSRRPTVRDDKSGETSQASDNVQEKQTARDAKSGETSHNAQERKGSNTSETGRVIKEEKPSKSDHALQLNAEGKPHKFQFCIINGKPNKAVCDTSKTVFGALNKNVKFKRNNKEGKEIIIRRSKKQNHEAAVKTNFPCCLIEDDEILQINFYENKNIASTNQETTADTDPKSLVTFYIRTRGMKKKTIMKSSVFLNYKIDYVCVFAHKGDTIEEALQHDGRFSDDIFDKVTCELVDDENTNHSINLPVDLCDGKTFELNVEYKKPQAPVRSDKNDGESVKHSQQPKNTKQKTIQEKKTNGPDPSTEGKATQNTSGNSPGDSGNSFFTDIKNILQTVLKDVLKQQENPQVQELLQKEYDKGVVECFTEVNKVKQIMGLSDSVCVIVVGDSRRGTGFLLFDRFILTNAHVVKEFVSSPPEAPHTHKLSRTLTAMFNHEVILSKTINLQAKSDLIAYRYGKDEELKWHDYALLELEAAPDNCTELLTCYKHGPSPKSGGIYIVGHPDSNTDAFKKMDLCFIIGEENQSQTIYKHISENVSCPYVSWQCWPELYKNRITYDSCFYNGSSGSPVFDAHCNLIGMHSGGFDYKEGERTRSVIEFSYCMQSIMESIITQVKTRSDIIKLLKNEKFKNIQENFDLGNIEDAYGANMPVEEEQQTEDEKMEVN